MNAFSLHVPPVLFACAMLVVFFAAPQPSLGQQPAAQASPQGLSEKELEALLDYGNLMYPCSFREYAVPQ